MLQTEFKFTTFPNYKYLSNAKSIWNIHILEICGKILLLHYEKLHERL